MPLPHFLFLLLAAMSTAGLTIWLIILSKAPVAVLGLIAVIAAAAVQLINAAKSHDRPQRPAPGTGSSGH